VFNDESEKIWLEAVVVLRLSFVGSEENHENHQSGRLMENIKTYTNKCNLLRPIVP
jgi:hypothetical protein